MSFDVTVDGLDDLERDWGDALRALSDGVRRGVASGVEEGAAVARTGHRWTTRTGETERGITGRVETSTGGGAEGVIESRAAHSSYLEEGTQAHEIRPKEESTFEGPLRKGQSRRAKNDIGTHRSALRWTGSDGVHFARVVHHPGTAPSPFMEPAGAKAEAVITREVEVAEEKAAAIMAR